MQTQAHTEKLASAAVIVTHTVESYEIWKRAFDDHAAARRNAAYRFTSASRISFRYSSDCVGGAGGGGAPASFFANRLNGTTIRK